MLHNAVESIDTNRISQRVTASLEDKTLAPFRLAVGKLLENTAQLDAAALRAQQAADACRRYHIGWVSAAIFIVLGTLTLVYMASYTALAEANYERQLAEKLAAIGAAMSDNRQALVQLTALETSVRLEPWDRNGAFRLVLDNAAYAQLEEINGKKSGVIYFIPARQDSRLNKLEDVQRLEKKSRPKP